MNFSPLSSDQVEAILPANTWTEIILHSIKPNDNGIYIAITEENKKTYLKDKKLISLQCVSFKKIQHFQVFKIVAVEINEEWYRAKLISYNKFQSDDTRIELIDIGSFYQTKLQNLYNLPYYFEYNPLVLPIKFKNFTPSITKITVKPLLSESMLHEGVVLVDVNHNIIIENTPNKEPCLDNKIESNFTNGVSMTKQHLTNGSSIISDQHLTNGLSITNDLNLANGLSIASNQNLINGHDNNLTSSYLLKSLRRGNFNNQPKPYDIPLKNKDYCFIRYFENFNAIYVAKVMKNNNDYEICDINIEKSITSSEDKLPKLNPIVGDTVIVFSLEFNTFYRGKILRNNENGSYSVYYIDYGNEETVPSNAVFELADELKKPPIAVKVGIDDLKHIQVNEEIRILFDNLATLCTLFMIEFDETSENCLENVKLKAVESGQYIDDDVKKCLSTNSRTKIMEKTNKNDQLINSYIINKLHNKDKVFIKHFEDMAHVYIIKDVLLFNDVILKTVQDKNSVNKSNLKVGDIVKVTGPTCPNNCRGKILKIDDNLITVMNIDFGYCEEVQSNFIYELSDELIKIPGLAIKVGIKTPIIEKSVALRNYIKEIEKIPLYLEFDEENSNGYEDITLKRKDNSENIFEEFLKSIKNKLIIKGISNESNIINTEKENVLSEFQTVALRNGDLCIVTNFEDFQNIHLCRAVKDLSAPNSYIPHNLPFILKIAGNKGKAKTNLAIGDIIKAISANDGLYYRAKVLNIEKNGNIHVLYIDFGNTEIVQSNSIFELSEEELNTKIELPVSVSIDVPTNAKTNNDIVNLFKKLINNLECLSIEYNETKSINSLEKVLLKELKSGYYINDIVLKLLPAEKIPIKNLECCILTHFENFDCLYVLKSQDDNFKFLRTIENSTDCNVQTNPVVGDIVKVLSPVFKEFYRAKIIEVKGNIYQVFYIDFGNIEQVQSKDIFELPDNLKKKVGLAIEIGIDMRCNVKINKEILDYFSKLSKEAEELSIEYDESRKVGLKKCILKVNSTGLIINNEVLKLSTGQPLTSVEKEDNLKTKMKDPIKPPEVMENKIKFHPLKNREIVNVRYFHNSTSVFVSRGSEEHLLQYQDVVDKTAKDTSKQRKLNIEIGDIVKVMFEDIMFRAKILKKMDKHLYLILFIDYGNEITVFDDEIFELPEELKKIPGLCIEIGFKGSPKIEKTDAVNDYFERLEAEPLYIEFDEENPNGLREAELKRKNNSNILDELINKPLNIKEEPVLKLVNETVINSPEPELIINNELKNGDIVFCSYFEDFNHIYLCKSSNSKSIMPENKNFIIDASKVKDITVKKNPKYGEILKVKYEEKIFRAKVLNTFGKTYTVFLIDIGKNINVSADEIFEISNDLKNVPSLCHKVGLKGAKDLKITKTIKDYFINLWYNEPIPLRLMYDEDNFNCFNEVILKKNNGSDIIDDLLKICSTSSNDNINQLKPIVQNSKSNGASVRWRIQSGEQVELLYGNNIDSIIVRPIKLYEDYKNILNEFKDGKDVHLKTISPKINENVVIYSSKYNGYYRAKIIGLCSDDTSKFRCSFNDYGYADSVPSKNIFELPIGEPINTVPLLSQRVSLTGLTRMHCNSRVMSYLGQLIGNIFILEYDKTTEPWFKQVTLTDIKSNTSINEEIHKLSQPPMSQQRRLERKIVVMPEQKDSELEKSVHPIKSGSNVFITHFENFNSIFIRDASYDFIESFNRLNKQMIKYYKHASKNDHSEMPLNIGDKVCVISMVNPIMYCRGQIIDKINNEKYKVFCVDFGTEELVSADDIFKLPKELEKPQNFVVKVQMQSIPLLKTENEKKLVSEYFKRKIMITNVPVSIEFNELNPKGLDDVVLKTDYHGNNILHEIRKILDLPPLNINLPGQNQSIIQQNHPVQTILPYPGRRTTFMSKQ